MIAYHQPTTLDEAIRTYAADPSLIVLAGGTDVYPAKATRAGWGHVSHPGILDISRIASLRGITKTQRGWDIGALTTWSDLVHADLPPLFDGLKAAAREVGSVQVQNCGTIGGNVCNASPAADGIAALLALRAVITTRYPFQPPGSPGEQPKLMLAPLRSLVIVPFIKGNRRTMLVPGEIVTAISVTGKGRGYFRKLGARHSMVISIAMVAAVFDWDERGNICTARVVVGACSPVAQRLSSLEDTLRGKPLDSGLVKPEHFSSLQPLDDVRATAAYRKAAALQLVRDIIDEAANDARRAA